MSTSPSPIEHGYLVLADISGYTSFVAATELDHAQEILTDLLETILGRFRTLLTICKLEGDAVFAYSSEKGVMRGETLLELVEATYVDFRERIKNVRRHTTCTCRACQSIPSLDLKFMVHHGDYVVQNVSGVRELAGSDVNLVHRLLKNGVSQATGWRAYALFTEKALEHIGVRPEGLCEGSESYEHLGAVKTFSLDLGARYGALMAQRRVVVEPDEALIAFIQDFDAPPPVVWDWLNDPTKRNLFMPDETPRLFQPVFLPGGRTGAGATTHCVHGKEVFMRETVLDWKPFHYYTVKQDSGNFGILQLTIHFEERDGGTTHARVYINGYLPRLPAFLSRPLIVFLYGRKFSYAKMFANVAALVRAAQTREPAAALPAP